MPYDYDPQKLLPDLRFRPDRLWEGFTLHHYQTEALRFFGQEDINEEWINFERPRTRKEVIYLTTPTGLVDEIRYYDVTNAPLAPFVKPRQSGKTDQRDPLADIQKPMDEAWDTLIGDREALFVSGDLSQIERYVLATYLMEGQGSVPGIADPIEKFKVAVLPSEKHKSYLDHDPTKKHRRRRRGY